MYLFKLGLALCCVTLVSSSIGYAQDDPPPSKAPKENSGEVDPSTPDDEASAQPSSTSTKLKVEKQSSTMNAEPQRGDEVYQLQIEKIEAQVNELKEEIFRARTRLAILKETVLASGLAGTEVEIIHRNEMGSSFKLERILYILDGSPIRQAVDKNGKLDQQEEIEIINGPITPGNHTLQVELIYRGNGYGVFSYLQSYRFTLNDVHTFRSEEGKRVVIKAIGYERGGITVDLQERPDIRFEKTIIDLESEDQEKSLEKK